MYIFKITQLNIIVIIVSYVMFQSAEFILEPLQMALTK